MLAGLAVYFLYILKICLTTRTTRLAIMVVDEWIVKIIVFINNVTEPFWGLFR